jgi:hypothetical protein
VASTHNKDDKQTGQRGLVIWDYGGCKGVHKSTCSC